MDTGKPLPTVPDVVTLLCKIFYSGTGSFDGLFHRGLYDKGTTIVLVKSECFNDRSRLS